MPEWSRHVRDRLAGLRLDPAREAEIVEELSQHLAERYDELRAAGEHAIRAEQLAIAELLDPGALARHMRPLRQARVSAPIVPGTPRRAYARDVWPDVRYALRMLRWHPGFAATAILTLALGIGANGAIFALVDATLLRPLPLPAPDRLLMTWERTDRSQRGRVSPLNLRDWDERNRTFEAIGGFAPSVGGMVMSGAEGIAETVPRQWVTARIFDALGLEPLVGRTFLSSDDARRANVVVLNESFWRSRFNADAGVIGRDIRLDGEPYTVVGVVPKQVEVLGPASIWALLSFQGAPPAARGAHAFHAIGRLKPGVSIDAAADDLQSVAAGLAREFPDTNTGRSVALQPLDEAVIGSDLRRTSTLFLAVVGFVLLICCANVASLLMARATVRRRELAIRVALGADRRRILRQLLTESLVLAAAGALAGLALGAAILEVVPSLIPAGVLPPTVVLAFDARVVAFCTGAALLVGFLFGLAPGWVAGGSSPAEAIASDGRTITVRGGRLRALLVAGEVAAAVVLLFGAGLLLRTLLVVGRVDPGYRAESVLSLVVDPLASRHPTPASLLQFYDDVEREVMTVPGVRSVAWASTLPLGPSYAGRRRFEIVGDPPVEESRRPAADYQIVSPRYFQALDLPVVAGRPFDERDTRDHVAVCLVNEALVRGYLQGRSPLGVRLAVRDAPDEPAVVREIVGVARQVKARLDETEDLVQIYVPMAQDPLDDMFLLVRPVSGDAGTLASVVRAAIGRVDKDQLVSVRGVMTLEDVAWQATGRYRLRAALVITFAGLALLLAMVGVFGVLAHSVEQRMRDIGVRRALGATTGEVVRLVVRDAARVVAGGAAIGLAVAIGSGRALSAMLFGVEPLDPATFAAVVLVLSITAIVSIAGPARRAARIDPAVALRSE